MSIKFKNTHLSRSIGVVERVTIPTVTLERTLLNPLNDGPNNQSDFLGQSVAISNQYIAASSTGENYFDGGAVIVWDAATGNYLYTFGDPNLYSTTTDQFAASGTSGQDIAIDGNYMVVGASFEHYPDGLGGFHLISGAVHVYDLGTGTLVTSIVNPNAVDTYQGDRFGSAVAISGNYVIVGAKDEDTVAGDSQGKAYIFDLSSPTPETPIHTLSNPALGGRTSGSNFGGSVSIKGNMAIVGDYSDYPDGYVYVYDVTTGNLINNISLESVPYTSFWAHTVSLTENYIAVGAYGTTLDGYSRGGSVYIYEASTGNFLHKIDNPNAFSTPATDDFGRALSIEGDILVVGVSSEDSADGSNSGAVYIFQASTGTLIETILNPNPFGTSADDYFGISVDISSSGKIVIGSRLEDEDNVSNTGMIFVYNVS